MIRLTLAEEIRREVEREVSESEVKTIPRSQEPSIHASDETRSNKSIEIDLKASQRIDRILSILKNAESGPGPSVVLPSPHIPQSQKKSEEPDTYRTTIFSEVKLKLKRQQQEVDDKSKEIDQLRDELAAQKESNKFQAEEYKKTLKSRLTVQRKEFEGVVNRHLTFIDATIAEKNQLTQRCEALSEELKSLENSFKDKLRMQEEHHLKDVKQQRELWQASEKNKRDKWISEKTKLIKDQTVKGLEPEIQRMIAQHKIQIQRIEERCKEDLIKEKRQSLDNCQQQLEQLRGKMITERQKACEEEREFARQRYQKQLERDEMEFQQQKRKMIAEHEQLKHYQEEEHRQARSSDLMEHKKELDKLKLGMEKERTVAAANIESIMRKHHTELQELREKLQIEKEQWQDRFIAKQAAEIRAWETQLKERLLKERDEELELIVQRLECESSSSSGDVHKRYQIQIEKLKNQTNDEIKQLQENHNIALDKVLEVQAAYKSLEDRNVELQKQILKLQHETISKESAMLKHKSELDRLKVNEMELKGMIRDEFAETLAKQERRIKSLEIDLEDANSKLGFATRQYEIQLNSAIEEKDLSLSSIEERVAKALSSKDEHISRLECKLADSEAENYKLREFIEKQCQELI